MTLATPRDSRRVVPVRRAIKRLYEEKLAHLPGLPYLSNLAQPRSLASRDGFTILMFKWLVKFHGIPVASHGKVFPGFLFHHRCKSTNLIDNEMQVTAGTIFIGLNLEAHAR